MLAGLSACANLTEERTVWLSTSPNPTESLDDAVARCRTWTNPDPDPLAQCSRSQLYSDAINPWVNLGDQLLRLAATKNDHCVRMCLRSTSTWYAKTELTDLGKVRRQERKAAHNEQARIKELKKRHQDTESLERRARVQAVLAAIDEAEAVRKSGDALEALRLLDEARSASGESPPNIYWFARGMSESDAGRNQDAHKTLAKFVAMSSGISIYAEELNTAKRRLDVLSAP